MVVAFAMAASLLAASSATDRLAAIETRVGCRIGVSALDTANGAQINYRPNERFRLCSTFKFLAAAAVMKNVAAEKEGLDRFVTYGKDDLLEYAPVTKEHVQEGGMKLGDLCTAAIEVSDNTAGNVLLRSIGGPEGLTTFLRSIGDPVTRLDRTEPELNEGAEGDERDTTTPAAMVADLKRLLSGGVLSEASRRQLEMWLEGNTTGASMIRAGVPAGWRVGDKTGRSHDGAMNDIAIVHPSGRAPIFLAIYTVAPTASSEARRKIVAEVARIVAESFSQSR